MKKTTKSESAQETQKTLTRAEKKDAAKSLIKDVLQGKEMKSNELIDEAAKVFAQRFQGEENENPNDVKGRIGSVLDVMKKEGEVQFDGGMYALKTEKTQAPEEKTEEIEQEKPVKKTAKKATAKKKETEKAEEVKEEIAAKETPAPKKRATKKKAEKSETVEKSDEAPTPVTEVVAEEKEQAGKEEKPVEEAPVLKKRGRKPKVTEIKTAETKQEEIKEEKTPAPVEESTVKVEEPKEETPTPPITEEKREETKKEEQIASKEEKVSSPQGTLMDMSFLFDALQPQAKGQKTEAKPWEKTAVKDEKTPVQTEEKTGIKEEEKPQEKTTEKKLQEQKAREQVQVQSQIKAQKQEQKQEQTPLRKTEEKPLRTENKKTQEKAKNPRAVKVQTADEKLQEAFLNRLHRLGGEYFEYYSVYLLEKYSRMNGRRLEMLKITAGERDGGIDGEIELTDRLGFRETIYIQAKNWDPSKGDEKLWVVGETLLQQFIGACVCRQAKEGKQHCRGIFITTSRFTPEAKKILNDTSDKFVGYDGTDLYEAAKECKFGLVQKNGEWALDEQLLSGVKAFYSMV